MTTQDTDIHPISLTWFDSAPPYLAVYDTIPEGHVDRTLASEGVLTRRDISHGKV